MTIRLIYVHLLEPLYLCQMPTRGHLGQNLDFQVNCNISFVLYYKIFRQDLCRSNDTTVLVILPAQPQDLILLQFLTLPAQRGRVLYCISFFLLLLLLSSSSICQHANISDTLGPIMLILGQSNKSVNAHFWHDQFGVKGHDGVTGVKKVICTKIAISSTDHMVWSCVSCILIS